MNDNHYEDKLNGVFCDVINCRFHGKDNFCHAESIVVESSNAIRKGETFCGTFTMKSTI